MNAPRFLLPLLCLGAWLIACTRPAHPRQAEIEALLQRYFSAWSAQDMAGYAACFDATARVVVVKKDGSSSSQALADFVDLQKRGHKSAGQERMVETPTFTRLNGGARVAVAEVGWRITRGQRSAAGVDYFTLARQDDQWRIVALVFYQD
jgi:hypothetical protein